jgi:murein DD-endopeptidase MepM/ murein hydrolase activator NlpD
MSANKSPMGFLVGALMLGVFWGLLSQWGEKSTEETSVIPPTEEPVVSPPQYAVNPAQSMAQTWLSSNQVTSIILKSYDSVRKNESLSVVLDRNGIAPSDIHHLSRSLKGVFDVRTVRPGREVVLERDGASGMLQSFVYHFRGQNGAPASVVVLRIPYDVKDDNALRFHASLQETPVTKSPAHLSGKVESTLYESLIAAGGNAYLVNRFADVFNWDIDFYREVQNGDTFKVITEKKYANGEFVGFGRVIAAEYVNQGRELHGYYFESQDEKVKGYFDDKGKCLEKTFLKNPMEIARITSRYGQRFHPVLKRRKQHNGVDYGASRGTPFWTVADGTVREARYSSSAGNMIVIRHRNGYETEYFHAKGFARGIRAGAKVKQRQIIGYVGTTGRSTGPHLHFGMKKSGRHVNPSKQKFPAGKPIPKKYMDQYQKKMSPYKAQLIKMEQI